MAVPLVEDGFVPDVFISGIASIERLSGGLVRITYYKEQRNDRGEVERVVALRVIRSMETWPQAIKMVARAMRELDTHFISDGDEVPVLDS